MLVIALLHKHASLLAAASCDQVACPCVALAVLVALYEEPDKPKQAVE
jgi:hypothetical protein